MGEFDRFNVAAIVVGVIVSLFFITSMLTGVNRDNTKRDGKVIEAKVAGCKTIEEISMRSFCLVNLSK